MSDDGDHGKLSREFSAGIIAPPETPIDTATAGESSTLSEFHQERSG
jgi:hypothetical protein